MAFTPRPYPYTAMRVMVEIRNCNNDTLIKGYETDLADDNQRRVFAEQMTAAYAAKQYSIVEPIFVGRRRS